MAHYNITEAKAHFSELVRKAMLGEEIIIAKDNKPVAKLVPIPPLCMIGRRKPGSAKDKVLYIAPDFDAPLEDFKDYVA